MRSNRPGNHCPVCGFDLGYAPWGESGDVATFDICGCCGIEFGYQDSTDTGLIRARNDWIAQGYPWKGDAKDKPADWDPEAQLRESLPVLWPMGNHDAKAAQDPKSSH